MTVRSHLCCLAACWVQLSLLRLAAAGHVYSMLNSLSGIGRAGSSRSPAASASLPSRLWEPRAGHTSTSLLSSKPVRRRRPRSALRFLLRHRLGLLVSIIALGFAGAGRTCTAHDPPAVLVHACLPSRLCMQPSTSESGTMCCCLEQHVQGLNITGLQAC